MVVMRLLPDSLQGKTDGEASPDVGADDMKICPACVFSLSFSWGREMQDDVSGRGRWGRGGRV